MMKDSRSQSDQEQVGSDAPMYKTCRSHVIRALRLAQEGAILLRESEDPKDVLDANRAAQQISETLLLLDPKVG